MNLGEGNYYYINPLANSTSASQNSPESTPAPVSNSIGSDPVLLGNQPNPSKPIGTDPELLSIPQNPS